MIKILIELIFAFIALKWLIIPFLMTLHINKMRKKTKQNIAKLEYVISLNGFMGKGKTSLSVGIITDLTEKISGEISFELDKTRAELKDIDFLKFDEDFEKYYHENFFDNNCYIFKTINDFLNEQEIDGFFTDFLLVESVKLKLIKYLIRYFILNIRGIITYSKGYIFNRYTKKPGMLLDDKGLEMVKSLEANNWQFELGVIYFDDEVQITRGNFQSGSKAYKISGITITLALIRNMSLGTTYRITTKQLVSNEEKQNRLLCGSNISIENVSPVLTSKKIRNLLFKIDKQILACILRAKNFNIFLKNCFKKKKNRVNAKIVLKDYFKQKSLYRVFHYYIQMINNYLFRKGIISMILEFMMIVKNLVEKTLKII